ncbi:type II secretion system protein M [Pseudomonas sp. ITA]|uniref:type II secretion system protein GspM n=1 Tax=Pseudomonas sp. ITA TaxID=2825841 RepID=UPI0024986AC7|nr:type II secretion system protein GspM [Pseudomonas sp. ITA]MDI2146181.1 type II secretion system protein M [Pseudomonas sp. ITA]
MFWSGLSLRERYALAGTGLLLAGLANWLLLIHPPLKTLDYWQAETPKLQAQAEALEVLLQGIPRPTPTDYKQALQQSLSNRKLEGFYQLESPDALQPQRWVVRFDCAPADAVMSWLLNGLQPLSLDIIEARLERSVLPEPENAPGTLCGTVHLEQALGPKDPS